MHMERYRSHYDAAKNIKAKYSSGLMPEEYFADKYNDE